MSKAITTPVGQAVYPHLNTPDTKFNEGGLYSVKLHVGEESFNTFANKLKDMYDKAYKLELQRQEKKTLKKASSNPVRVTEEGDFEIYAKQDAKKMTKTHGLLEFQIVAFDSQGKKIDMPKVGSGSKLKLAVEPHFWYVSSQGFGMTLRLKAVQIIELVEYGGGTGDGFGFTAEEDGYVGGESFTAELEEPKEAVETETTDENWDF